MNNITTTQGQYSPSIKKSKEQGKVGRVNTTSRSKSNPNPIFNETKKQPRNDFRETAAYTQALQRYTNKAVGATINPYNVALANWFEVLEILDMDLGNWRGQPGKVLRVKTLDNVLVTQVDIAIRDGSGALLEAGYASPIDNVWWEYTTCTSAKGDLTVYATAQDLPGNTTEMSMSI